MRYEAQVKVQTVLSGILTVTADNRDDAIFTAEEYFRNICENLPGVKCTTFRSKVVYCEELDEWEN